MVLNAFLDFSPFFIVKSMRRFGRSMSLSLAHAKFTRSKPVHLLATGAVVLSVGVVFAFNIANPTIAEAVEKKVDSTGDKMKYANLKLELQQFLAPHQIDDHIDERIQRGKPWNSYHKSQYFPELILLPESTDQVSKIVKLCSKYQVPVIPFGGGTSLEGQTLISPIGGVSLDFNHMKKVLELNEEDLDVRVEAGLGYVELNEILKNKGLWFPLDPGPGASIGGAVATVTFHVLCSVLVTFLFNHVLCRYVCLSMQWLHRGAVRLHARERA